MSNMLKYDYNRAKVLPLHHTNHFTNINDLITERRISMKKLLKNLSTFAPVLVLIVIIVLAKVLKTFNIDVIINYLTSNWIGLAIAFVLGTCWTKFVSRKRTSKVDIDWGLNSDCSSVRGWLLEKVAGFLCKNTKK